AAHGVRGVAHVRARHGALGVPADAVGGRGNRADLPVALVLVAGERLVRDRGDGELVPDRCRVRARGQAGELDSGTPVAYPGGAVGGRVRGERAGIDPPAAGDVGAEPVILSAEGSPPAPPRAQ